MSTTTVTLTDFLLARIAEDEAHAQKDLAMAEAATPGPWRAHVGFNLPHSYLRTVEGSPVATFDGVFHDGSVSLAARFHPETVQRRARRVLAECEAKRRIVEEFDRLGSLEAAGIADGGATVMAIMDGLEIAIRALALPYADHPDYREEYKP